MKLIQLENKLLILIFIVVVFFVQDMNLSCIENINIDELPVEKMLEMNHSGTVSILKIVIV
jgi:hypothetical protein